jgi:hypothetical protein
VSFGFVAPEQHARGRDDVPVITEETREKIFNFLRPVLKGEPRTHEWWPIYELVSKPLAGDLAEEIRDRFITARAALIDLVIDLG